MEILLSSLFSGVMTSFVFYFLMISVKPRVKVANKMCIEKQNDEISVCTIKVVNLSKTILRNIDYQLVYYEKLSDGSEDVKVLKPRKAKIMYMDKYSRRNEDYAYQISYEIDTCLFNKNPNWRFEFNFIAMHSFSNSIIVKKRTYETKTIKEGGYESGKNMEIISV